MNTNTVLDFVNSFLFCVINGSLVFLSLCFPTVLLVCQVLAFVQHPVFCWDSAQTEGPSHLSPSAGPPGEVTWPGSQSRLCCVGPSGSRSCLCWSCFFLRFLEHGQRCSTAGSLLTSVIVPQVPVQIWRISR